MQNTTALAIASDDPPAGFRFGPAANGDGSWSFQIHAPNARSVQLTYSNDGKNWFTREMCRQLDGVFHCADSHIKPVARYWYVLDGEHGFPDPWSRYQPDGPHEASQLVDEHAYCWKMPHWPERPWEDAVLYELHIGAFTPEGTFVAAIERLGHLRQLGVTVLQIMPVWTRPNGASWGYDANYLFSVDPAYGTPDDFKLFIDAAHAHGLQVLLDVVYNHLGIEGNYLGSFDHRFLSADDESLWGAKLNFDRDGCHLVREMIIDNGIFWLEEFCLDGLRIDSPLTIDDGSKTHILEQLARTIHQRFAGGRPIHLVLENDHYAGRLKDAKGKNLYNAALNIEGGEMLFALAKGSEIPGDSKGLSKLFTGLAEGQVFCFSDAYPMIEAFSQVLHSDRQIVSLHNHDLIGNSQHSQRAWAGLDEDTTQLMLAIMCLSPATPLLFMGDEFGCTQPFPFFCNFRDISEHKILAGRKRDFAIDLENAGFMAPFLPETFDAAKLHWPSLQDMKGSNNHRLLQKLLEVRRCSIQPLNRVGHICNSRSITSNFSHRASWDYDSGHRLVFELDINMDAANFKRAEMVYQIEGDGWIACWWIEDVMRLNTPEQPV